jgi:O-antigen/teichoic acid export membrane protein
VPDKPRRESSTEIEAFTMPTFVIEQIPVSSGPSETVNPAHGEERNRRVFVSASVGIFQRLVQVGSTLVLMPLLLRALGPAKFGVWGAVASLAWLSGLVDIGTGTALVTLVARSSAGERAAQARRHIAGALSIGSGLGGLMLLLAFVASIFAGTINGTGTVLGIVRGIAGPYLIAAIGLAINLPLNSGNNVWMALQKGYFSSLWELMQTVLTTAGLITATFFTRDVRVYIAVVYLGLIVANTGSLVHLFLRYPELRPRELWMSWAAISEVAGEGVLYFIMAVMGGLCFMLDNVLTLGLLGPEASARMTIAMRICIAAVGALGVMSQPLWPAFADAAQRADRKWILKTLFQGSTLLVGLTLAGSALLLLFGERLLGWWLHTNLGIGRGLLWAIAAWVVSQAMFRVPNLLLNGLSILRYQTAIFAAAAALALLLKFVLAPSLGVAGILWATTMVIFLIVIPASLWRIWKWAANSGPCAGGL